MGYHPQVVKEGDKAFTHPNQAFIDYVKEAEGYHGQGKDSHEGGLQTSGWGHKNIVGEDYSGESDEDMKRISDELFDADYEKIVEQSRNSINNKYNKSLGTSDAWGDLSQERQNMLLDFTYNTGQVPHMLEKDYSGRFTQFGDAIMSGDNDALMANDEEGNWIGKRYFTDAKGNKQSLTRNSQYRKFFDIEADEPVQINQSATGPSY